MKVRKETKVFYGDLESYSSKYYKIHKRVDAYVFGAMSSDSNIWIWNIDFKEWIDEIIEYMKDNEVNIEIYFHNLGGFDWSYLLPLFYKYYDEEKITSFIDDKKNVYYICYKWRTKKGVYYLKFKDSLKLWNLPLATLGKEIGLKKLDYGEYDILDIFETKDDYMNHNDGKSYEYFKRDIEILVKFASQSSKYFPLNDYKLTLASTAKNLWKETNVHGYNMSLFSLNKNIDIWDAVKRCYRGGLTINNPKYQLKELKDVYVYDINSLYPSIMINEKLPYGKPIYEDNAKYSYKIFKVHIKRAIAKIFPFIQTSTIDREESAIEFDMLKSDFEPGYNGKIENTVIYMNNYLYKYFAKYYEGEWEVDFICNFKEKYGMFNDYINKFKEIKENSQGAIRLISKLLLNSLYGKFGEDIKNVSTDVLKYEDVKERIDDSSPKLKFLDNQRVSISDGLVYKTELKGLKKMFSYIPIAEGISCKSRLKLIDAIVENIDNFVYADTDSIHLLKPAKGIVLHESNFGHWKFEGKWDSAIYRRAKHYYHINNDGSYELKGGGFDVRSFNPDNLPFSEYIKENFTVKNGKRVKELVDGGIILFKIDYNFKMKEGWKNESWRYFK